MGVVGGLLISGSVGFASFLAYLGYGYLDSWHGAATLVLLPTFGLGMYRAIRNIKTSHSAPRSRGRGGTVPGVGLG